MIVEVRKVELHEVKSVYSIYCEIEKCPVTESSIIQAESIYQNLIEKDSYTLGAYVNNELIGAINVYKNMQYYPTDLDAPFVHLECCMIKKDYQNKGVGTKLLTEAFRIIREEGCTYIIAQSPILAMQKILFKVGLTDTTCKNFGWDR